jgi:hypothetical protein
MRLKKFLSATAVMDSKEWALFVVSLWFGIIMMKNFKYILSRPDWIYDAGGHTHGK